MKFILFSRQNKVDIFSTSTLEKNEMNSNDIHWKQSPKKILFVKKFNMLVCCLRDCSVS